MAQPATLASLMQAPANVNVDAQPDYANPGSLGQLAASLPQGNVPKKSKFTAANILGVLGDAFSAYGGRQPTYAPFLQQEKILGQQQDFERQKFNAELQMRMQAMLHPAEFMQAEAFNQMPPDQQYRFLHYQDATQPINVSTPQGTQNIPRTETKQVGGKTYYRVGTDWYEMGAQ